METFAPCPNCGNTTAKKIGYTWWGGFLGPWMLNHVKCSQCGTAYNGKSGAYNTQAILLYNLVAVLFSLMCVGGMFFVWIVLAFSQ